MYTFYSDQHDRCFWAGLSKHSVEVSNLREWVGTHLTKLWYSLTLNTFLLYIAIIKSTHRNFQTLLPVLSYRHLHSWTPAAGHQPTGIAASMDHQSPHELITVYTFHPLWSYSWNGHLWKEREVGGGEREGGRERERERGDKETEWRENKTISLVHNHFHLHPPFLTSHPLSPPLHCHLTTESHTHTHTAHTFLVFLNLQDPLHKETDHGTLQAVLGANHTLQWWYRHTQ